MSSERDATLKAGLYRTTSPLPGYEDAIKAQALVYVGKKADGSTFVCHPHENINNRWFWREPTYPLPQDPWPLTMISLPAEGFYTLPKELVFEDGAKWLKNAIVQLGYNRQGGAILFVAELHRKDEENVLRFSDRGHTVDDELLFNLTWAPICPIEASREMSYLH